MLAPWSFEHGQNFLLGIPLACHHTPFCSFRKAEGFVGLQILDDGRGKSPRLVGFRQGNLR
jgi:hypothetical protein